MKFLVVYDDMDKIRLFTIHADEQQSALLLSFHGHFINVNATPKMVEEMEEFFRDENGDFIHEEVEGPIMTAVDRVIVTGFH